MDPFVVGQGILGGEAVMALCANVWLFVEVSGLVLLKLGALIEFLLAEFASAVAVLGVSVDVAH